MNNSPIDGYIKAFPAATQEKLEEIRAIYRHELPDAEEVISYGVPAYRYQNKTLVFFAGWKNHISTYPVPAGDAAFQKAIEPYRKGRGTLQYSLDKPLPKELIQSLVRHTINERLG